MVLVFCWRFWPMKMRTLRCPETSGSDYQLTHRHSTEKRTSQLHHCTNLKIGDLWPCKVCDSGWFVMLKWWLDIAQTCLSQWTMPFTLLHNIFKYCVCRRSQWPRGLRLRSVAARLLRSWVRIPPGACLSVCVVSVVRCQVEVSAKSWSLVQRITTDCVASLCVI